MKLRNDGEPSDLIQDPAISGLRAGRSSLTNKEAWIPDKDLWRPDPSNTPQQLAYGCEAKVIGYGGAAGGGKTSLAIGKALTQFRSSTIFRRDGTEHTDNLAEVEKFIGTSDGLNRTTKLWRNLPNGNEILFGAMPNEKDKKKYRGRRREFMCFDEATEFSRSQVDFVLGWCLKQALIPFNPPSDIEGEWVIDFFAPWIDEDHDLYPTPDGEILYYLEINGEDIWTDSPDPIDDGEGHMLSPQSRTFFHAKVEDNKYMLDAGYDKQLESLPTELRNQVRYGLIKRTGDDNPLQLIPREWVRLAQQRWKDFMDAGGPQSQNWQCDQTGADVARGGKDRLVITNRYQNYFGEPAVHMGKVTNRGQKAAALIMKHNEDGAPIGVDVVNVGNSAFDHLEEMENVSVFPLNGGAKSGFEGPDGWQYATDKSGKYQLRNKRVEWWWRFYEALDPDFGENLMLPPGNGLIKELTSVRYKIVAGKLALELKADVVARIGISPDWAESIIYAHANLEHIDYADPKILLAAMQAAMGN